MPYFGRAQGSSDPYAFGPIREKLPPPIVLEAPEDDGITTSCWGKASDFELHETEEEEESIEYADDCERVRSHPETGIRNYLLSYYGCGGTSEVYYDEVFRKYEEIKIMDTNSEVNYAVVHRIVEIKFKKRVENDGGEDGFLGPSILRTNDSQDGGEALAQNNEIHFIYKHPPLGEVVGGGTLPADGAPNEDGGGGGGTSGSGPDYSNPPEAADPPTAPTVDYA